MQTVDHWWTDRVEVPSVQLQRARLGGVAHARNRIVPGHRIAWRFDDPEDALRTAILVREPASDGFRVVVWNLSNRPVPAAISGGEIRPGQWSVRQGRDADGDDRPDGGEAQTVSFGPGDALPVVLAPGATVLEFALTEAGPAMSTRPDVGIGPSDLTTDGQSLTVTVHSLGGVASPPGRVILESARGDVLAEAGIPTRPAPDDLRPKVQAVTLPLPDVVPDGSRVRLILDGQPPEISRQNNETPYGR
jgi:hypothetical protein